MAETNDQEQDPKALAYRAAVEAAEDPQDVGGYVDARMSDEDANIHDYRFESGIAGYEGWQWSITMYHDPDTGRWTVDESSLVPSDKALLAPRWIPWKERITPDDLSPTDVLGTDEDDPRMEPGAGDPSDRNGEPGNNRGSGSDTSQEDVFSAVSEFMLGRRHVMTAAAREETAKRWYSGPHGPKSMSTQAADGNTCGSCAFFIPLQGELGTMFGVCANKWSQDDGKVVSLDHGCGGHSEIEPPEPTELWVQSDLRVDDDLDIEIVPQAPREENPEVELIEESESAAADGPVGEGRA